MAAAGTGLVADTVSAAMAGAAGVDVAGADADGAAVADTVIHTAMAIPMGADTLMAMVTGTPDITGIKRSERRLPAG